VHFDPIAWKWLDLLLVSVFVIFPLTMLPNMHDLWISSVLPNSSEPIADWRNPSMSAIRSTAGSPRCSANSKAA
jgi:hypothetical protein